MLVYKKLWILANFIPLVHSLCDDYTRIGTNPSFCPCPLKALPSDGDIDLLKCVEWCSQEKSLEFEVKNKTWGLVEFVLDVAPEACLHDSYEIQINVSEGDHCEGLAPSNFTKHSTVYVTSADDCSTSCDKRIHFEVKYLFTGCYRLLVKPYVGHSSRQTCISSSLSLHTDYEKHLVGLQTPVFTPHYANREVNILAKFDSLSADAHPEVIQLSLYQARGRSQDVNCEFDSYSTCCYMDISANQYTEINNKNGCSCKFDEWFECHFYNVSPGNYCISLEVYDDLRCTSQSLWQPDSQFPYCSWHYWEVFTESNAGNGSLVVADDGWSSAVVISIISGSLLIMVTGVLVLIRLTKHFATYKPVPTIALSTAKHMPSTFHPEKIQLRLLLLYPRDCPQLMAALTALRNILKKIDYLEVADLWDDACYEEAASLGTRWKLQWLADPSTKLLLLASPVSVALEAAQVSSCNLQYYQPHPFDSTLCFLFSKLFTLTFASQRLHVIRFDDQDIGRSKFKHIPCSTVFTLPDQLDSLLSEIFGQNPLTTVVEFDSKKDDMEKLQQAVNELFHYKANHPDYLNNFIKGIDDFLDR